MEIEKVKNEIINVQEDYEKGMKQHKEDTDQVMMKLLKQIKDLQTLSIGGSGLAGSDIKQDTVVNILVRIELIENEIRNLKNVGNGGAQTERISRGMKRHGSLKEFEETRV